MWLEPLGDRARRSPRYQWWVLWVSLSGLLATNLLFTVFVVALPEVSKSLHASFAATTWVVTGPLLAYGVVAPLVGKAGDLFGHRRLFMAGIMAETVAAALSALAPNIGVLIAARIIGGMVGASIGAASMALVLSVFDQHDRVKALGFWSLVGAGGPVIGVALGGPVIQLFGWRWMFFLQVPLLLAASLLAMAVLPKRASGRRHVKWEELDLDWAGAASIAACVAAFLLALTFLPNSGLSSPLVLGLLGFSVLCGVVFRAAERRASDPIFPLSYLRKRNFVFPIAAQSFANFAYLGGFFLTPLLLEYSFGYLHNQSVVGFLSLPRPIVFSTIAPFAGYLAVRVGERTLAVVGTTAVVLSMGVFALAGHSTGLALVEIALGVVRNGARHRVTVIVGDGVQRVLTRGSGDCGRLPTAHESIGHRGRDPGDGNGVRRRPPRSPRSERLAARLPHRISGGRGRRSAGRGRRRHVALDAEEPVAVGREPRSARRHRAPTRGAARPCVARNA